MTTIRIFKFLHTIVLYTVILIVALNIQTYNAGRCVPCINSGICGSEKRNDPVADVHVCSVTLLPQNRTVTKLCLFKIILIEAVCFIQ